MRWFIVFLFLLECDWTDQREISTEGKKALSMLRGMIEETRTLMQSVTEVDQKELIEEILDREEENEELNATNPNPLLLTMVEMLDHTREVLSQIRDLRDKKKKILRLIEDEQERNQINSIITSEETVAMSEDL